MCLLEWGECMSHLPKEGIEVESGLKKDSYLFARGGWDSGLVLPGVSFTSTHTIEKNLMEFNIANCIHT